MAAPPRLRPRFERSLSCSTREATQRLRAAIAAPDCPCRGREYGGHFILRVPESERHFWSPQLSLDVEGAPGGGTVLRGLFGPHPSIWTFFVAAYALAGFSAVIGLLFGFSQWSLGQPPHALWAVPAAMLFAGLTYGVGLIGRRLGYAQVLQLRDVVDRALADEAALQPEATASSTSS